MPERRSLRSPPSVARSSKKKPWAITPSRSSRVPISFVLELRRDDDRDAAVRRGPQGLEQLDQEPDERRRRATNAMSAPSRARQRPRRRLCGARRRLTGRAAGAGASPRCSSRLIRRVPAGASAVRALAQVRRRCPRGTPYPRLVDVIQVVVVGVRRRQSVEVARDRPASPRRTAWPAAVRASALRRTRRRARAPRGLALASRGLALLGAALAVSHGRSPRSGGWPASSPAGAPPRVSPRWRDPACAQPAAW